MKRVCAVIGLTSILFGLPWQARFHRWVLARRVPKSRHQPHQHHRQEIFRQLVTPNRYQTPS